jgi:4-hydroxy-tetrahydrodipicolinate synthase
MHAICACFFAGDVQSAARAQLGALALMDATMAQPNPIPIKAAAAMMGLCREELRLPLCPMLPHQRNELSTLLQSMGLGN